MPHLSLAVREMSDAGFEVFDVESLRAHYALTLAHWSRRLEQRLREAAAGRRAHAARLAHLSGRLQPRLRAGLDEPLPGPRQPAGGGRSDCAAADAPLDVRLTAAGGDGQDSHGQLAERRHDAVVHGRCHLQAGRRGRGYSESAATVLVHDRGGDFLDRLGGRRQPAYALAPHHPLGGGDFLAAVLQRGVAAVRAPLVAHLRQALRRDRQPEQLAAVRRQRRGQFVTLEVLGISG